VLHSRGHVIAGSLSQMTLNQSGQCDPR